MVVHELIRRLLVKPITNKFPAKYLPRSVNGFLEKVSSGKAKIIPPIPTPPNFRGKLQYDRESCRGCGVCVRVCPADAIELKKEEKKIKIYISRCAFCGQCVDACPFGSLSMDPEQFMLSDYDRLSPNLVVE